MNTRSPLPARAGVSFKAEYFDVVVAQCPRIGWFEVHAENYMAEGGPAHYQLTRIRANYPLSIHGVGMSIGSDAPLNADHLARLKVLVDRYQPAAFSEHLAWSTHDGRFLNDLLPLPYNASTLDRVCEHIDTVQNAIGMRMLLENPSTYVSFRDSTMSETEFLSRVSGVTGCGLLLDVNNVHVSSMNQGFPARSYIDSFPVEYVDEIHLAGHASERDDIGEQLLIDTHDRAVAAEVWALFRHTLSRSGPRPALIEWDARLPEWQVLLGQAERADAIIGEYRGTERHAAIV